MNVKKSLRVALAALIVSSVGFAAGSAFAETHEVQMLNKDPENKKRKNVFIPSFLKIQPGDTVKFISVDKGHNAETIKKMFPKDAKKFKSKISKDFEVTLDVEGAYAIKCTPHYSQGMVALIVVGDNPANLEEIKGVKVPKKAGKEFEELFAKAAEAKAAE